MFLNCFVKRCHHVPFPHRSKLQTVAALQNVMPDAHSVCAAGLLLGHAFPAGYLQQATSQKLPQALHLQHMQLLLPLLQLAPGCQNSVSSVYLFQHPLSVFACLCVQPCECLRVTLLSEVVEHLPAIPKQIQ
jgi:hypothetical protein